MRRMDGRENFLSVEACGLQEYFVYFKKHTERQAEISVHAADSTSFSGCFIT